MKSDCHEILSEALVYGNLYTYCLTGCLVKQSDATCGSKVTGWVYVRVLKAPRDANEADMSLSPVYLLRERDSYQASMYMYKNLAPMPGHLLVT